MRIRRLIAVSGLVVLALGAIVPALAQEASFVATLGSLNGGPGRCRGTFTFDGLGSQLTYRLTCDGLKGVPATVHLAGPTRNNVSQVFPVQASPIIGTASLSDAETRLLKDGHLFIDVGTNSYPDGEVAGQIVSR